VYGNVYRGGRWYVVGHCHLRQGLRTLRLDRVAHAEVTAQPFLRPDPFDAVEYLNRALASVPRGVRTELFLHTDLECARRELFNGLGVPEAVEEGVLLKGYCDELEWYARELMRLPFDFDIRQPVELRATLARLASGLARRFQ
jgi:predicted DNA-binding transcriptional regulator YafY